MVVNQLLADLLVHASQRVVVSGKVRWEALDCVCHQLLNSDTLVLGDSGGKAKAIDGTTNTDSARVDGDIRVDIALNLADIHVRGVPGRGADSVVLLDQRVKDGSEVLVRVPVSGVDTAVLVVELDCASNGLGKSEPRGLSGDVLQLVPLLLGDVLGNKRVLGGNEGEVTKVGLLVLLVLLPQGVDAINHLLDELNLGVSKPVLVGDVIGEASLAARLSTGSTGLQVKLLATSLQLVNAVLGPARQVNVHRGPHASAKVGGAGVDVTEPLIEAEVLAGFLLHRVLDSLDTLGKPGEDLLNVSSLLHGDDAELILLVDPDEESLLLVVEDATTLRPVTLHTSNGQVPVSGDKEEVVVNELLADPLVHASQRVVVSGKVRGEVLDGVDHQLLNSNTLVLGDSRGKAKAINGATNTDSARVDGSIGDNITLDLAGIHVRGVLCRGADSVVLTDERVKDRGKVLVRVPVTSVDTAVLVVKLNGTSNGLDEGESGSLGLDSLELLPLVLGDVLGNKRVLGLDGGEGSVCLSRHCLVFASITSREGLILLPEGVDAINHLLDELNLGVSEPVLVGDVVGVSSLAARLSAGSTGLQVKLFATSLQLVNAVLGPARQVNVHRGPHASAKVGGAGVDVTEPLIEAEVLAGFLLNRVLDSLDTLGKPGEDLLHISSLLHGDDAELILLVDPDEESLLLVVEDATTLRPVTLHTSNGQVPVSGDEEEVVVNELLAAPLVHASQRVVVSGKVRWEALDCVCHQLLNSDTLVLGDSGGKAKAIDGTTNTDSARVDRDIRVDVALNLADIHVRGVPGRGADSVVLLDQRVKDGSEVLVRVPVSGVDTAVLVVELDCASNGLGKSEPRGLSGDVLQLVPLLLGDVLGNKRVL